MSYKPIIIRIILLLQMCFSILYISSTPAFAYQNTLEKIKSTGVLVWGFDAEGGAPYVFYDLKHPSKLIGFEVDLVEAIAREMGVKVQYFQNAWDSILLALQRGDFDIALNGIEITPDREQAVLFSRPYFAYAEQIVTRASEIRINCLEDLRKKKVGTLYNTVAKRMLDEMGDIQVNSYSGQVEPFKDLLLSRIDAVFVDMPVALYYAMPNPQLRLVGEPVGEGYYGIAFRKEDTALVEEINTILEKLLRSGELKKIYSRWGLWNTSQEKLFLHDELLQKYTESPPSVSQKVPLRVTTFLPTLLKGALVTIGISILSMMLAVVLGLILAIMRLYGNIWLQKISTAYIEIYRGTPLLIQLYILYYGLPNIGITLSALAAAILGLGMNYAAYEAEIYRAGIQSVPKGQTEAALSLGMSMRLTLRRIVLPQAFRITIPPMTNDFVALFKDSSLVSVIAIVELTKSYSMLAASSMNFFTLGIITALLYFGMSYPLSLYARKLEKKLTRSSSSR
ncbi:MAG: ABC transporter permease subunit [Candidatus Jettenia sp.]|nr:MAG: ABC transporter permease subunit [Candidatus Jettenia sp. AMX1]MBC6928580.1 ABC transporter permease subunit [Candidatus Jettenia sp.]MCE7880635.1 ABC transporter permease subunit [Candidatus Jettenia sp. AMX1]MCQ3927213.1 amino acid ABC transporter permease [Candidatus Jettenia sp.]MDL1938244.1 ABC transporter permease subunit [Candidatus Jettenia sp. AMX1]